MAKNRKSQAAAIQFAPVLKVVLICSLICGSAVGYVWQKNEIYRLSQQIRQREIALKQLTHDNQTMTETISFLKSPVMLDRRAKELNLGLAPTQPLQVVRLQEPVVENGSSRQFSQRSANLSP